MAASSPTARRYALAARLKELRVEAGCTPEQVAKELACSTAKVSRIESGQRLPTPLDLKVLAGYYGLSERVQADLRSLATDARKRGWWHDFRALDEQTRTYIGLESAASTMYSVETLRINGLLQTAEYAQALVPRLRAPEFWQGDEPAQIIEARIRRQKRVLDGELQLRAVMDEAALSRAIGPPELMQRQIHHLIEAAQLPNVALQVVTFDIGSYPGMDESFSLLSYAENELQDTVYVEGFVGHHVIRADDRPEIVQQFHEAYDYIARSVALGTEKTLTWLREFKPRGAAAP